MQIGLDRVEQSGESERQRVGDLPGSQRPVELLPESGKTRHDIPDQYAALDHTVNDRRKEQCLNAVKNERRAEQQNSPAELAHDDKDRSESQLLVRDGDSFQVRRKQPEDDHETDERCVGSYSRIPEDP